MYYNNRNKLFALSLQDHFRKHYKTQLCNKKVFDAFLLRKLAYQTKVSGI